MTVPSISAEAAIVCAVRPHGETAVIARLLTAGAGLVAAYVAGGRGRVLRPVLIPGNAVAAELSQRSPASLPFARIELVTSRALLLGEPLPAAAISWATTLVAAALPERQPYPVLHGALGALLEAVAEAPSARGWLSALVAFEALTLRELGYGAPRSLPPHGLFAEDLALFDQLGPQLARYPLADTRTDVMAARALLRERLGRIGQEG